MTAGNAPEQRTDDRSIEPARSRGIPRASGRACGTVGARRDDCDGDGTSV